MKNNISGETIAKAKKIYKCLGDEESKEIFVNKLLCSVTGEDKYWHNIILRDDQETVMRIKKAVTEDREMIVYGAGTNCASVVAMCEEIGCHFTCICDRDKERQKNGYLGFEVISPEELVEKYREAVVVISTILYQDEVTEFLEKHFPAKQVIAFTHKKLLQKIQRQYFPEDILKFEDGEVFVDGGCYDFETSKKLMEYCKVKKIFAFEPDRFNIEKIKDGMYKCACEDVVLVKKGLWDKTETLFFSASGDIMSHVVNTEEGSEIIEAVALDEIIHEKVTFIKMDIEGAEMKALEGAKNLIVNYKPKLAICIYHRPEDTIDIPTYIKELVPEYRLYIRHYSFSPAETVLYATL